MEEASQRRGTPLPDFMRDKPSMHPPYVFYWTSFWELSTERHELGSIPWSAIDRYCSRWGINNLDEFDFFCKIIRGMDREYIKYHTGEREKRRGKKK